MAASWTSVQIATLAVEALTPITVAGLGVVFARTSRRIEQVQWANQTVVTRRLDIFTQLAPGLNLANPIAGTGHGLRRTG